MMRKRFQAAVFLSGLLFLCVAVSTANAETAKEGPRQEETVVSAELLRKGKALFTGEQNFTRRGAPCVACHALRYPGVRGGNWGPDLTDMYTNMGEEGMMAVLQSPPYAGMKKMYEVRPMTEDEIKALIVFAKDAALSKKEDTPHFFPWAGIAFFGVVMGVFSLYKRRIR